MLYILLDADMLCFVCCSSVEREIKWGDGLWTLHADAHEAEAQIDDRVEGIVTTILDKLNYEGEYRIIMCISDPVANFRKKILSTYKANRIGKRKPVCYREVLDWIKAHYVTRMIPTLEADDVVGILATHFKGELYHISEREADKWFYTQTLIGDKADNYDGCPGIGEKTAEKIFKKEGVSWGTVKKTFLRKGLTEEDALQQARVARILRDTEWKDGKPILWSPSK